MKPDVIHTYWQQEKKSHFIRIDDRDYQLNMPDFFQDLSFPENTFVFNTQGYGNIDLMFYQDVIAYSKLPTPIEINLLDHKIDTLSF